MAGLIKYYVLFGEHQGEFVGVGEVLEGKKTVMATLVDDHGKNISDEFFPIPVGYLERANPE
jgi:hypothetical protein